MRLKIQKVLCLVVLLISFQSLIAEVPEDKTNNKGLFTIQFSWNSDSYSKNLAVKVEYKKKGFLAKKKASGGAAFSSTKNQILSLSLAEGEYEIYAVHLTGAEIGYNKYLKIPLEGSFVIKSGEVSNGGLIYLIRENKQSNKVMALRIDNTPDVFKYISTYKNDFAGSEPTIKPAWKFLENEKVDKLVNSFADLLVKRESARKRPKITYLYATLGTVLKMKKDSEGKVLSYKIIPTPTYQQIKGMGLLKNGSLLCTLDNGGFLYGDSSQLNYMPLPKKLEGKPEFEQIKGNQFLLVDSKFNIYWADDSFNWTAQNEFRMDIKPGGFFALGALPVYPKIYKGKQHLYIYSPTDDKRKILLQSDYETLDFKSIPLSKEVKKISLVSETLTHVIIGPILRLQATAKRPAYLYFKEHNSEEWVVRDMPRGDCKRFFPGKDWTTLYAECSKGNWLESIDHGVTWTKWQGSK